MRKFRIRKRRANTLKINGKMCAANGVLLLPLHSASDLVPKLGLRRDPFDRILSAQTLQHEMRLATVNNAIHADRIPLLPMAQ
jgi:PIN domain nuclease of toxin-antitoxin system